MRDCVLVMVAFTVTCPPSSVLVAVEFWAREIWKRKIGQIAVATPVPSLLYQTLLQLYGE